MSGRPAAKKLSAPPRSAHRFKHDVSGTHARRDMARRHDGIELGERFDLLATRGRIHQQLRERFRFQLEMSQKTNYRCNRFL